MPAGEGALDWNPRIIEIRDLPSAIRRMQDVDDSMAGEAVRLGAGVPLAMRLDSVDPESAAVLRREADSQGLAILDGIAGFRGSAPRILAADDTGFLRIAASLEAIGARSLASAIRGCLTAYRRPATIVPWADGEPLSLDRRTRVMGILNVTPDSFSDGRSDLDPSRLLEAAAAMAESGADIVDVGGESSRPGATAVSGEEEIRRVIPVIERLKRELAVRVSVDTVKPEVARRALAAGADMVNDVSGLADPEMAPVVRAAHVPIVVMHRRGSPTTMQADTDYVDLMSSVIGFLRRAMRTATEAGIAEEKIVVDPGLGFGKSAEGNLQILRELPTLRSVGRPILVGASRKSFIGAVLDLPVGDRLEGSLAAAAVAAWRGASIVRVHDVGATVRALRVVDAVRFA